ncbi:MAG: argininosuccinate lyase, partial [Actinobacteria bacterium]|nr:argininosuccinate lyase [Actinomycetota bacterium]
MEKKTKKKAEQVIEKDKLWKGRMDKTPDSFAEKFTASIGVDRVLYMQDITGTAAHVIGLESTGLVTGAELKEILSGLKHVVKKIEAGKVRFEDYEDIHSLVEYELAKIAGKPSEKIHTGRSRNDQVVLDELLFLKESIVQTLEKLVELEKVITRKAEKNMGIIFPAYTHLQRAQPVLVSHYLLSYFDKFSRNI